MTVNINKIMSRFNYIYEIARKTNIGEKIPISENIYKYMYNLLVNNQRKVSTKYGSELYLTTHDLGISRQLFRDGITQPALTGYFQRNITEGLKIVDIGSHIGYFSILFTKLSGKEGRVDAFEPIKENFDVLCENIELNGFENCLQAHNQAIWDMSGTKKIDISDHQVSGSISETGRSISVIPLDKVIDHSVDLLKIDVDGGEESVLRGSTNVIKRDKPKIVIEYNEPRCQKSFEEIRSEHLSQYTDMKVVTKDQKIIDEEGIEITVDGDITDIILS